MTEPGPEYPTKESSQYSQFTGDEAGVSAWAERYPVAHRVYWIVRAALAETDGANRKHHHRAAVMAIHDAFAGRSDRQRLGMPATDLALADVLGVSSRVLYKYRRRYADIFDTTRRTIRQQFITEYYGPVFEALALSASSPVHTGSSDRRLFFQLAGDLTDRLDVTSDGEKVQQPVIYLPSNGRDGDGSDGD